MCGCHGAVFRMSAVYYISGLIQAIAPQRFLQHFKRPRQSPSKTQVLEHTQGPEGRAGQYPGFSVTETTVVFFLSILLKFNYTNTDFSRGIVQGKINKNSRKYVDILNKQVD